MKKLKHTYIFAVVYRWLWYVLLSRIPLTQNGLGKLWGWLVGVFQEYLTTFAPDAYLKVAVIASKVWSFLFMPSLLILLLVSLIKSAKKNWSKSSDQRAALMRRLSAAVHNQNKDKGGSAAPVASPETYYFVRFLYIDDTESYHERLIEVTRLLDKPEALKLPDAQFTLRLDGFSHKVPRVLLEAVNSAGKALLNTDCVVLPADGSLCGRHDWSFQLLSAAI